MRLAGALDAPLRQRNVPLIAASFAPDLAGARALDYILSQLEPFPAAAVRELHPESLFTMDGAAGTLLRAGPSSRSGRFPDGAGRVLDSRRSGNYNHGARAGRPFPAGRRVPR
jgi:hypothetical protein